MVWISLLAIVQFCFKCYHEILLALVCFLLIPSLCRSLLKNCRSMIVPYWPIIGMLPSLIRNCNRLHDWSSELLSQSRGTFRFSADLLSPECTVVTCNPANLNHILITNFPNFPKGGTFYEMFDFLGDGIFNADFESWKLQRQLAHAHMSSPEFRLYLAKSTREIMEKGLIPVLSHVSCGGDVVDLQDVMLRFMFDSSCELIWGVNPGCLSINFPTVHLQKAMDDAEEAIFDRYIVPPFVWKIKRLLNTGSEKKLAKAWETVDHLVAKYVSCRREELREPKDTKKDFLSFYMESKLEDEMGRTKFEKFLRDTTLNLFIAARGTTSATLTWFFWLVSNNPTVETKILEELKAKCQTNEESPPKTKMFDANACSNLTYLHASLLEALRLYPPVPFNHKEVKKQQVLPSGELLEPGTKILYTVYAMGRMEWIWGKDCLKFKPERWISETGQLKFQPSFKFPAFNAGPRTCLGKDIALTQMKAIAATVLYSFHFEVLEDHPVTPKTSLILFMKHGLKVWVKGRNSGVMETGSSGSTSLI